MARSYGLKKKSNQDDVLLKSLGYDTSVDYSKVESPGISSMENPNDSRFEKVLSDLEKARSIPMIGGSGEGFAADQTRQANIRNLATQAEILAPMTSQGVSGVKFQELPSDIAKKQAEIDLGKDALALKREELPSDIAKKQAEIDLGKDALALKREEFEDPIARMGKAYNLFPTLKKEDLVTGVTEYHPNISAGLKAMKEAGVEIKGLKQVKESLTKPTLTPQQAQEELKRRQGRK
jgi:hypothetical protein